MAYCSSCGRLLAGEGWFCQACGAPQVAAPPGAVPAILPAAAPPAARPASSLVGQAPPPVLRPRQPFPGWAVALFVTVALGVVTLSAVFVLPVFILGSVFSAVERALPDDVHAAEVRTGVRNIQMGIEVWRAEHASGRYPPVAAVTPQRLGKYVDPWPQDPYNGGPMLPTGARGGYTYKRAADGLSFTLAGFGENGAAVLTVPELPFP